MKRKTWRQRRHDNLKKRKKIRKWTKNWLRKAGSIKVEANVAGVTGSNKKMEMTNKNGKLPIGKFASKFVVNVLNLYSLGKV